MKEDGYLNTSIHLFSHWDAQRDIEKLVSALDTENGNNTGYKAVHTKFDWKKASICPEYKQIYSTWGSKDKNI